MNDIEIFGVPYLKKGKGIHIKKENRGLFTKYCNGKVTNECILRGKNSPDPKIRKRATFVLNSRRWKHQEGGTLTKEDSTNISNFSDMFVDNPDHLFKSFNFEKDTSDVSNYFDSYLNSEGIKRILKNQDNWWKSRHPYRKFYDDSDKGTRKIINAMNSRSPYVYTVDMPEELSRSVFIPRNNFKDRTIFIGTDYPNYGLNFLLGHEYFHGKQPFYLGIFPYQFNSNSAQGEALQQNKNTKPGHDSRLDEKNADVWGLKYLFYKEGIYDSRSDKDITIDQVKELRKRYPKLRPFEQMTDEQILFQMNNVAQKQLKNVDYVKKGKKLNKSKNKPFGHRSILDNGWQSTKLLKNLRNVLG